MLLRMLFEGSMNRLCLGFALASLILASTMAPGQPAPAPPPPPPPLMIEHVTVLTMTADGVMLQDQTVTIREGRIAKIEASAEAKVETGVRKIDGTGKFLMPGLTDAHVHLENDRILRMFLKNPEIPTGTIRTEDIFLPYVANGVLQVFNLSATSETVGQRDEVESGRVVGPHIALAAMIDGPDPIWPLGMTRVAATPNDGRQIVRDASVEGYEIIKVYSRLDLPTFTAIVDEARKLHMPVVGHIPQRGKGMAEKFFQPGFGMVAHAEEFAQQTNVPAEAEIPHYVEMAKRNGTWLTATLSLDERLLEQVSHPESLRSRPELHFLTPLVYEMVTEHNPYVGRADAKYVEYLRAIVAFNRKLVKAFAEAGIPVLAGSDTPVPGMVAGFSLHDELEVMARCGLSNKQVLEGATRLPAEWLGIAQDRGVIAPGRRADLLLLDADPMADVANTRKIAAVIAGGRFLARSALDQQMKALKDRYLRLGNKGDAMPR
ncbi:amidohydrolase family protein [Singulisphaera sp. PoT]|uniref:amidohydrolase family protein n=1 Tax=Singulisphaera sp. PoT TaxID=3411797 RepID=UPI003BF4AA33